MSRPCLPAVAGVQVGRAVPGAPKSMKAVEDASPVENSPRTARTCSRGISSSMQTLPLLRHLLEPHRAISSLDQRENQFLSTPSAHAFAHWNVVRFVADSMDCRSFEPTGGCG